MSRNELTPAELQARKDISKNIKQLINNRGKTQSQVADDLDLPLATLNGYVTGKSLPNAGNLQKIADYFNVPKSFIDPRYRDDTFSRVELADAFEDHAVFTYQGKKIPDEDLDVIKRILESRRDK